MDINERNSMSLIEMTVEECVAYLKKYKEAEDADNELRSLLYCNKIDINELENGQAIVARDLLARAIGCRTDDIDWWIYDNDEKAFWVKDEKIPMGEPEQFVQYYKQIQE